MKWYEAWVPWFATVRVRVQAVSKKDAIKKIRDCEWQDEGTLCHYCARHIEIEGGAKVDEDTVFEVWEEE